MPKILVVDDEKDIVTLVKHHLKKEGFAVIQAFSGGEALDIVHTEDVSLIILDIMLPGLDGIEICRQVKKSEKTANIPVILLTAKSSEPDIVSGFQAGADDYITKPFSPAVLVERVKAVLRRAVKQPAAENETVRLGDIEINQARYEVKVRNKPVRLTNIEFRILLFFAGSPGRFFNRDRIMENVWGTETVVVDRAVDVHIRGLRRKLGRHGAVIETLRGVGYRIRDDYGGE